MRSPARAVRLGTIVSLAVMLASCADLVDTELGLDAQIASVAITVSPENLLSFEGDVTARVGEHAEGTRRFTSTHVDFLVGSEYIGSINPTYPSDFDFMIAPGESRSGAVFGSVTFDNASIACGAEVTVLLRWTDGTTGELGMFETTTTDVTCM
ncbi:MAG: hypothetical protein AB7S26_33640 [Sandaracinaceae bacterium]